MLSINPKTLRFQRKKSRKSLQVRKKVVPLHPLSLKNLLGKALKKEFFERLT